MNKKLQNSPKPTNPKRSQPEGENSQGKKVMTTEQFNEILGAILEGKYSWACVLILSFAGHNPSHYLPYRTYNRLLKENCLCKGKDQEKKSSSNDGSWKTKPQPLIQSSRSQVKSLIS